MLTQPSHGNAFLTELSGADYALLRPHLTAMDLRDGDRLQGFGADIEQLVFPHGGLVALTMPLQNTGGAGAILLGRDGILGALGTAANAPAMCDAEVYVPGTAARMSASSFRNVLDQSPTIRRLAARYNAALVIQAHQNALCNAVHPLGARVARLLLEIQDRCGGTDVPLTQITLSHMLGVQRTTVNLAAGDLEEAGLLKCHRGSLQIIKREQLSRRACECYRSLKGYISGLFAAPIAGGLAMSSEPLHPKTL